MVSELVTKTVTYSAIAIFCVWAFFSPYRIYLLFMVAFFFGLRYIAFIEHIRRNE